MNLVRPMTLLVVCAFTMEMGSAQIIPRRNTTRPCLCCGIPSSPMVQYQFRERSQSEMAMSSNSVFLDVPKVKSASAANEPSRLPKLFQWDTERLTIEHCSVSQMALQLYPNGEWVLSLRADQNRKPEEGDDQFNPTLHIKRNEFALQMRFYDDLGGPMTSSELVAGRPVLEQIDECFWVENGQPKYLRATGTSALKGVQFDRVDRVELEFFFYR